MADVFSDIYRALMLAKYVAVQANVRNVEPSIEFRCKTRAEFYILQQFMRHEVGRFMLTSTPEEINGVVEYEVASFKVRLTCDEKIGEHTKQHRGPPIGWHNPGEYDEPA